METKIISLNESTNEIEINLTYEEVKSEIDTKVKELAKKIKVDGFRPGKVPLQMIKKIYGDALEYEAAEKISNKIFWKVVKEQKIELIGEPVLTDLKFEPGQSLVFKVKYEIIPTVSVKDYKGLIIEVPEFKVTDEEVEYEIKNLRKANRTTEEVEVVEDKNHIIKANLKRINSNEPHNADAMDIDLTEERINQDLVSNAIGKKKGESFTFKFKDHQHVKNAEGVEEVVEEEFEYEAEILEVKKIIENELSEEAVKKLSNNKFSSEQELRDDIKNSIEKYYEKLNKDNFETKLVSEIIKNNEFNPPAAMVVNVLENLVKDEEEHAKKEKYKKFDRNEAANRLKAKAENTVRWYLLRKEIATAENITISDEEFNKILEEDAAKSGIEIEKIKKYYDDVNYKETLIANKVFDFLKENNEKKFIDRESYFKKETKNEQQ